MTKKESKIISITLASWGILMITSGLILNNSTEQIIKTKYTIDVTQKQVAQSKTNEIKLKEIEIEINNPISVKVEDYLENPENLDTSILKALKLDTSLVNINEAGTYTYTISFKKKKYNGTITVKEKELPKVDIILKNIRQEKNTAISTNLETYISNKLTDEVRNHITLDLSKVVNSQAGIYQYTVTYNGNIYTGNIEIYEPQPTIKTPNSENNTEDKEQENETETEKETQTQNQQQ